MKVIKAKAPFTAALLSVATLFVTMATPTASAAPRQPSTTGSVGIVRSDLARPSEPATGQQGLINDGQGRVVGGWKEPSAPTRTVHGPKHAMPSSYSKEYVGGGVWTYGVYYDSLDRKHCWSKYYHTFYRHSATAQMNTTLKVYAGRSEYADAHLTVASAFAQTCKVY